MQDAAEERGNDVPDFMEEIDSAGGVSRQIPPVRDSTEQRRCWVSRRRSAASRPVIVVAITLRCGHWLQYVGWQG